MTETPHRLPTSPSRRVAFVELADHAVNVLARYEEAPSWEVALVVARDPDCKAAVVAEASRIPVHDSPDYSALVACDRVVVGNVPAYIPAFVREMLQGTAAEVVEADEALSRLEEEEKKKEQAGAESRGRIAAGPAMEGPDPPSGDAYSRAYLDEGGTWDEDSTGWEEVARRDGSPGLSAGEEDSTRERNAAAEYHNTTAEREAAHEWEATAEYEATSEQVRHGWVAAAEHEPAAEPEAGPEDDATGEHDLRHEWVAAAEHHSAAEHEPAAERKTAHRPATGHRSADRFPRSVAPPPPEALRAEHDALTTRSTFLRTIASRSRLFDPATLLGLRMGEQDGIAVNTRDPQMIEALSSAARIEHAKTASLMLPDTDTEHLRVAAACGMSENQVATLRIRRGEGLAGKAFSSREPQTTAGWIPGMAEEAARPVYRLAASFPVIVSGRAIGILSVNAEAFEAIPDSVLSPLPRLAKELAAAILAAIDLGGLDGTVRRSALQMQVDRFLSLDLPVAERLRHVTDALRTAAGADYAHLYLLDELSRRLRPLTGATGICALTPGPIPVDRGFLGWVMRHGRPQILEACDERSGERVGILCYPLHASRSQSLLLLENIPLDQISRDELLLMAEEVLGQVEETIGIEVNVRVHELISELNMRIADQIGQLGELPAPERIPALVEFTVNLVAAEAAAWIPGPNQKPVMSKILTPQAQLIQSWGDFESLARWAREKGSEAEGAVARWWDSGAPAGPSPYVGVPAPGGEGVLMVFFSPEEDAGAQSQVPPHVLWQVLNRLTELIAREEGVANIQRMRAREPAHSAIRESESAPGGPMGNQILQAETFARLIHREQRRSERYGHSLCLTRFKLTGPTESTNIRSRNALGSFLLRLKGERDLVSEIKPRLFVMLCPENRSEAVANPHILAERWRAEQPSTRLEIEQRICPQDGAADVILENWLLPENAAGRAA